MDGAACALSIHRASLGAQDLESFASVSLGVHSHDDAWDGLRFMIN